MKIQESKKQLNDNLIKHKQATLKYNNDKDKLFNEMKKFKVVSQ